MTKIMFVCHGNICRSTMAEFVMKDIVGKNNRDKDFLICSSATSYEEIGNDTYYGTKAILDKYKIPYTPRKAVRLTREDCEKFDYIIGMDSANVRNIKNICGSENTGKVYKLLEFTNNGADVADPWYTRDFEATYRDVKAGCTALFEKLK